LAAENARRTGGLFMPAQLFVVRNGLNLQMFESVPANVSSQAVILGIGSLLPVKRWDRLIKAAAALKRCGLDCVVQIAGSGPLQRSLEVQAEGLGVRERVEFLGYVDDIPALLARSTFVVHTSDVEGCSNAVMEAMASRRAVVATDAGDTCSIVQEGQTGFVVSRGDDAALFDRIARLIRDRQLCRRMGDAGRIKAEREFGADRLVSETLAVYRAAGGTDL
jgi:glycosyltransferase involved in cell wall biosynthesis